MSEIIIDSVGPPFFFFFRLEPLFLGIWTSGATQLCLNHERITVTCRGAVLALTII